VQDVFEGYGIGGMELPTTSYALLGILAITPMSGYELAQATDRSIANFWPVSRSQVYSELARLEGLHYVTGTDVAQERVPDKRVFEVTPAGQKAFEDWLATPGYEPERMRLGFCVKMFFGHDMPRETMIQNLERFAKHNESRAAYLKEIVEMLSVLPEAVFTRATASLGLRIAEAAKEWAEEMLADLPEYHHTADEAKHEEIHSVARELFRKAPPRASAP
jgi:DNA-binding PadR family transcriptional regulator